MKQHSTYILRQSDLAAEGIDLSVLGGTSSKNRPYMVITANRQMTWLVPLTTQRKRAHGRKPVTVACHSGEHDVEAVCTDMFSIATDTLNRIAIKHGRITKGGTGVLEQLAFAIMHGRLGVYPDGSSRY